MGLDITFYQRKDIVCPNCGEIVTHDDINSASSGGRVWYEFLEAIGYYVPPDQRTEEEDGDEWYGKDMVLTDEQARKAYCFIKKNDVFDWDNVSGLIARALLENDNVVINADW